MNDGMRLKVLLEERGLTVKEVARVADIPPITLYSIISRNSDIKLEYAVKLATALGLKTKDIMGDENLDVYLEEYSEEYSEEVRSEFKRILKVIDLFEEDEIKNAEFLIQSFYQMDGEARDALTLIITFLLAKGHFIPERTECLSVILSELKKEDEKKQAEENIKTVKEIFNSLEADYENLKEAFGSKECFFERYGHRPALEFTYGFLMMRKSICNLKKAMKDYPAGTTLKNLGEMGFDETDLDPIHFTWDYEMEDKSDCVLPKDYEDKYDYDFLCKLEDALNEFAKRIFDPKDEKYHLPEKPIEEIIARAIFIIGGDNLREFLEELDYFWKEEDYAITGEGYEDEEDDDDGPYRYDEYWLYDEYLMDADVDMMLFDNIKCPEEARKEMGIFDYSFESLFQKVFWQQDKSSES